MRTQFIDLLSDCLEADQKQFYATISEVSGMLSKALLDANPTMKKKAASFADDFCEKMGASAGPYMKKVVHSLVENLKHQHSQVRRKTL